MSSDKFKNVAQFFFIWGVLSLVPILYFYLQYRGVEHQIYNLVQQERGINLEFDKQGIMTNTQDVLKTFRVLSDSIVLNNAVTAPNDLNSAVLKDFWRSVLYAQNTLSRLRLVNLQGQELVNVYNLDNNVSAAQSNQLINLNHSNLFDKIKQTQNKTIGVYIVNAQKDHVDLGFSSPIRLVAPLLVDGQRRAYFIADMNTDHLYNKTLSNESKNIPELIDIKGNYLLSKTHTGRLEPESSEKAVDNFATLYPAIWHEMTSLGSGAFKTTLGWISFVQVPLHIVDPNLNDLYLVDMIGNSDIAQTERNHYAALTSQLVAVLAILGLLSVLFLNWNRKHIKNTLEGKLALAAMEGMSAIVITDKNNKIIKVNSQFSRLSGYQQEDVLGKTPSLFSSGKHEAEFYQKMWQDLQTVGVWEGEIINRRKDGRLLTEILRIQAITDDNHVIQYYVASFVDISERKILENRLREQSEKDALTDIPNRRKFDQVFRGNCYEIQRYPNQKHACFAICDIDHFKSINDTKGHAYGDHVIRSVAQTLKDGLRESDFLARIGGEEFAVILPHTSEEEAQNVLERLRITIYEKHHKKVTISIGYTTMTALAEDVYQRADMALYEAKSCGRNRVNYLANQEHLDLV
ncbi:sensor domain-containing diguanylate cyclase [Vibrio tritonius]|uniref:sensor domain-containing diguanylate cyclase n=1 Tax=Vibrio tritonius TaxID=1435069 RepID=UPI0008380614|nr:sensor domain-containing diguanylate cyclase [Vibrio tritonius]